MIVCRLDRISRHYSTETVFEDVSAQVEMGHRIGLVGPNGAGKSTLLRVLAQWDKPDTGAISFSAGTEVCFLEQFRELPAGRTLAQEARQAMEHLETWFHEMVSAGEAMASAETDDERTRAAKTYDDRQELLRQHGGFDFEHRIEEVLLGLGFTIDQFDQDVSTLSGGQQSRVLLAKLLLRSPDLMLLDEPTNHLDIATTQWLEDYLSRQQIAMLIVSHDRYFLDKTVNIIWELQGGKLTIYPGNYAQYRRLRAERQKVNERQASRQQGEIARLEEFVRRNKAGQLAKQAKSREKMIGRLSQNEIERIRDLDAPPMTFGQPTRSGDIVAATKEMSKAFGEQTLFRDVTLEIERGQRVGIIGPNGAGKTTLLRILLGEEEASAGRVKLGHNLRLGFLRQEVDDLDPDQVCLDAVRPPWRMSEKEETFRGLLARFGIGAGVCEQRVRTLSGGQRTRLALARICAFEVNLLVLDEPTNHLDLWAVQALEDAIVDYEGTVIVVSHDRCFLNNVCERLFVIENQSVQLIPGNYDRYVEIQAARAVPAVPTEKKPAPKEKPKQAAPKRKRRFPFRKAEEIEADIARQEASIADLEASLQDPEVFKDGRRVHETVGKMNELKDELARLLEHWEEAIELNS